MSPLIVGTLRSDPFEVDALRVDRYIESLLAGADRRALAVPVDTDLDPRLAAAARTLHATLVRVHPSFRFEERLARRLTEGATAMRRRAAGLAGTGLAGASVVAPVADRPWTPAVAPAPDGPPQGAAVRMFAAGDGAPGVGEEAIARLSRAAGVFASFGRIPHPVVRPDQRPVLAGAAALTSAALSIGAAAVVAWRRSRPRRGIA